MNSKKLLNSKWTAVNPENREKHFLITEVEYNEDGAVIRCVIEAIATRRSMPIQWRTLGDNEKWLVGWR